MGRLVDEAVVGEYPRLSLLASLPGGSADGSEGYGSEWDAMGDGEGGVSGGFLQLDLEVIDAKLVKWNRTKAAEGNV